MVGALQRLSRLLVTPESCYLEVGIFQGLTLLSVAKVLESGMAYGIDNFAFFDPDHKNFGLVKERQDKLGIHNTGILNMDYEDALENLGEHLGNKKVSVYFVDGPHDYRSQLVCLLLIQPWLADDCVIMVDDCNYPHVRQANRDFLLAYPEFKLMFEAYTPAHPHNLRGAELQHARDGWWNGVNILVRDRDNRLERTFPVTERSRLLYENDHLVHSARFAGEAPFAMQLLRTVKSFEWHKTLALMIKALRSRAAFPGYFKSMNTYSQDLPAGRYASFIK